MGNSGKSQNEASVVGTQAKELTSVTLTGCGKSVTAATSLRVVFTPSGVRTCPKYSTSLQ